jgi:hypothetical protein
MKTKFISTIAIFIFVIAGLMPENTSAQKPKSKTEKIIVRSSDGEPMEIDNLRDTIIISKDGKDTTIIKTMKDGREKKVTVHKVITSGDDKGDLHWVEAETEINDDDGKHVIVSKSSSGEPCIIKIEKRITKGDGSDSVVVKEIRHKELSDDEDFSWEESIGEKHKTITVISSDGKDIETEGDGKTTIIYMNDDKKGRHHKMKKHGRQQKVYIIEEEKTIKKEE